MTGAKTFIWPLAVLLVVAMPHPVSAAEFVEVYKAGLAAAESLDWQRTAEMMQRAIALQPEARPRVKRALFFKRYIPHYYLGLARFEQGDCAGALISWAESRRQEIVTRTPEYEQLKSGEVSCRVQRSDLERSLVAAKESVMAAGAAAVRAHDRLADLQALGRGGAESLASRLQAAETALRGAEDLFRQGSGDTADLALAAAQASEAREGFESITREASQWLASIAAEQVQMRQQLLEQSIQGRELIRRSGLVQPVPPGVAAKASRVTSLIDHVSELDQAESMSRLRDLFESLQEATRELRDAIAQPPPALTIAAEAYLTGQYAQALESLSGTEEASPRLAAQVHLLRAAAYFSLYFSQGAQRAEVLEKARREVRAHQSLQRDFQLPSRRIFSPRFIAFFERVGSDTSSVESADDGG